MRKKSFILVAALVFMVAASLFLTIEAHSFTIQLERDSDITVTDGYITNKEPEAIIDAVAEVRVEAPDGSTEELGEFGGRNPISWIFNFPKTEGRGMVTFYADHDVVEINYTLEDGYLRWDEQSVRIL